jgi:hypothetical protein
MVVINGSWLHKLEHMPATGKPLDLIPEFRIQQGAGDVPRTETAAIRHFQGRMRYGKLGPDTSLPEARGHGEV